MLFLLLGRNHAFSQQYDSLLTIQRKADPREKIYVQFDKGYYNAGETIWYKAYLFTGLDPSVASKNFYAEFLDAQGNVLTRQTAPIVFSGASGSFDLDSNYSKPAVFFRGYTVSALNSDTGFLFTKAIRVLSPKATPTKAAAPSAAPTLTFLPEGGDWFYGLASNLAFIATNANGLPVNISGSITEKTGEKVAEFATLHNGMGSMLLIPQQGKTYTATWKTDEGKTYTTDLPAPKPQGVSLSVNPAQGGKHFVVARTKVVPESMRQLHLLATMNQQLMFQATINLTTKEAAAGLLPTKEIPSGILQITVFDASNKPLAERIVFVNNHDFELDGDAYIGQKDFSRRGLNKVEIVMSDTLPANFSLAVTDADLNESNKLDDNIISHMLLTGELRGKVVDPYYYFYSNDDSVAYNLDLVMLTHGWRRYNWDNLMAGKTPSPRLTESDYLSLNGQIAGMPPGSYRPDLQLVGILQTADSAKTILTLPVDRNGRVFMNGLLFYDKAKLFFNFNNKKLSFDKNMLMLDNGLYKGSQKVILDSVSKASLPAVSAAAVAGNLNTSKVARQAMRRLAQRGMLENITVKAKVKTPAEKMEDKYVSGLFSGDAARSFDLVNDPLAGSYMDIFQYLQGKVAGLQINTGAGSPSLSWRGGAPVLYLNEMQVDADLIASTPVSDIAYVKVFRPGESIVSGSGGGVIAIYTRKGGDAQENTSTKGLNAVQLNGYTPVKQFFSPDYATPSERDAVDDVRSTLYWNPTIYLDKNRRHLRLQFYNNDITKRFRLVMEGFNTEGKMIHVEKIVSP